MEVYVDRERYNPLLKRKEVYATIKYNGATPSRNTVRSKIAGLFNAELDRVVIDYIKTEFGKTEAKCYAKIYDTHEDMLEIEEDHIIRRNFGEQQEEESVGESEGGE